MKKIFILTSFLILTSIDAQVSKPKLVIGIIVDQMRDEYLYRFYNDFGPNGFKRMMTQGFTYHNMHFNYMPTFTAPGHASVYTGTTPAFHGIMGNEYYNKFLGKEMYCVDDENVRALGIPKKEEDGKMSPKNLKSTTITDELKLATNFKGKVIGMSIKDRGAILPAGHFADWAFWLSDNGNFISSSFYGKEVPLWVDAFNVEKRYMTDINKGWNLLRSPEIYNESLPDRNPYEGKINGNLEPIFPYDLKTEYDKNGAKIIKVTPFGNSLLANFAKESIYHEKLGQDDITDFLAVSFSSTDYVGHIMGPRSMELQDTYLRLDETLADFLNYLDQKVGKNEYVVFLTADHACAENAQFLHDHKYDVHYLNYKDLEKDFIKFSEDTFKKNYVVEYSNQNLFLDKNTIVKDGLDLEKVSIQFKNYIETKDYAKRAYLEKEILNPNTTDKYLLDISRGYDPKINGQIVILHQPAFMEYYGTGTTHGTPYGYDTHVPALFYGKNIPKGESFNVEYITEIAPTLSQILRIPFPNSTEAKTLTEIVKKK